MNDFISDMHFEMEEIPLNSRSQKSWEHSTPQTTFLDSQRSIPPPQNFPTQYERLDNSMNFVRAEPQTISLPEASLRCSTTNVNGSILPPNRTSGENFLLFGQNNGSSQTQKALPILDQPNGQKQAKKLTPVRAPKAPTISAKRWEPHTNRIRQLFINEKKSYQELREIMNKELGITATLRQYKVQIQRMKLEKNGKEKEQKAVLKHILYREYAVGKKSSHVRLRGHKISQEKLSRWAKENLMDQPSMSVKPPSPLPSCVSIYTSSVCEILKQALPFILENQRLVNRPVAASDMTSALIQRLLRYTQSPGHMIESREAREVFNDLQLILSYDYIACKGWNEEYWNPSVIEDTMQVRNFINMSQALFVKSELKETRKLKSGNEIWNRKTDLSKITNSHAAWETPYGIMRASFWTKSNESDLNTPKDATRTAYKTVSARLAIILRCVETFPTQVIFDFTPHLDPTATVTYQAIVPNNSKVFKISRSGKVRELIELLEKGTASLTDRDEEGCSLLNSCALLCPYNDAEVEEIERHKGAECMRITLEAGADISLGINLGLGSWSIVFMDAVAIRSLEILKHMLDFGELFINLNDTYEFRGGEFSALKLLASDCGYEFASAIDVVDKAILLLNRKAKISCRDENGDTVLHTLLKCERYHEMVSKTKARSWGDLGRWGLSFKAPTDLLMVFITAGADLYATNDDGEMPSAVAFEYGREDEWIEALELCGYDSEEVLNARVYSPTRENQTSRLSFQEYCQQRQKQPHPVPFGEYQVEDSDDSQNGDRYTYEEDDHEEARVSADNRECVDAGTRNMEILGELECTDSGMDVDLNNGCENHGDTAGGGVVDQFPSLDDMVDNNIEGMDVNLDEWLNNGMDFMQSFNKDGIFSDTTFE